MKRITCATVLLCTLVPAQTSIHATSVVAFDDMSQTGGGIFNPANLLGPPDGTVDSLGIGGWVTLGFSVTITDGPGADFIVAENSFYSGPFPNAFAEAMFVEVSSDGVNFARIPSVYLGPAVSPGPFGVANVAAYRGFAGIAPANVLAADPADVVDAGGDAFDLADLSNDPLVLSGAVDLHAIHQIRLVDVRDGIDRDSNGVLVYDPGAGSSDPDAITVIHHTGNLDPHGPLVDVVIPPDGAFEIAVDDPDGLSDLDPVSLHAALYGMPVPFAALLPLMRVVRLDATGFRIKLIGPLPPGTLLRVSASVKDRAGHRSGATR